MLRDRLMGVLCLGVAVLAATWGGNDVLQRAEAQGARGAAAPAHTDTSDAGSAGPDTGDVLAGDPPTTVTAAPPSSTTTASAPGATTTTVAPGEAPAELAKRALLTESDVPAGFTVTTPAPADGSDDSPVERCLGPDATSLTAAIGARARSATMARADTGSVSSSAVVFDQPATAEKVLGLMTTSSARSCFEHLINARLARNPRLSQDVRGSLGPAPSPGLGDGSIAFRFDVRLPAEDVDSSARPDDPPVRFVADFVLLRKGRTVVLMEFDNLRQPWADSALKAVATSLVARV